MSFKQMLEKFEKDNKRPIRIGLLGAGQMGTGLISQIEKMNGMKVVAVADVRKDRAYEAYQEASVDKALLVKNDSNPEKAAQDIEKGKRIACHTADMIVEIPNLDVVVESTGIPEVGAKFCHDAIMARKSVVNMNVETDVVIGYQLTKMAEAAGVVYTLIAGDEPGSVKELYDFATTLGFEIVCIGKGKNNPLHPQANPDTVAKSAKAQNMNPKMLAAFEDGTKTMAEMTAMANGTGYEPEIRGAYGPSAEVADLPRIFCPKEDGGILNTRRAVDYAMGKIAPGVFVIITTDQPKIIADLNYLHVNNHGKYWALYRPYHMANLEAPISILRAFFYKEETLATHQAPVAETITMAKRDLKAGEKVDYLGGYTVYGSIEKAIIARKEGLVPLGLTVGATITKDIKQGQPVHYAEIELNENQTIYHLRWLQDQKLGYL
ncbi:MAG: NAD(P)H-dependent oxidoreductase [Anaerolineaceae bacterium]